MGCSLCDCVVYVVGFFYSFYGPLDGGIALSKNYWGTDYVWNSNCG